MWTEYFRPTTLDDIIGHGEHINVLKEKITIKDKDNKIKSLRLMFYGPPGTGKTSTAQALINDLKISRTFQKNASDDRTLTGMSDIREFVLLNSDMGGILFLDECDNLTSDAQDSLRRIIDSRAVENIHIILCVNDLGGVSEELQDRLVILQFKQVDTPSHVAFLRAVLTKSGVTNPVSDATLGAIIRAASGDIRQSINELCACYILAVSRGRDELEARHKSTLSVILATFWTISGNERLTLIHRAMEQGYTCSDIINLLGKTICECDTAKEEDIRTIFLSLKAIKAGCEDKIHMLTLC